MECLVSRNALGQGVIWRLQGQHLPFFVTAERGAEFLICPHCLVPLESECGGKGCGKPVVVGNGCQWCAHVYVTVDEELRNAAHEDPRVQRMVRTTERYRAALGRSDARCDSSGWFRYEPGVDQSTVA